MLDVESLLAITVYIPSYSTDNKDSSLELNERMTFSFSYYPKGELHVIQLR